MTALLDAVNRVLGAVALPATNTLEPPIPPAAALARRFLEDEDLAAQTEGWTFNTEPTRTFTPDVDGKIQAPANLISFAEQRLYFITVLDGFFWDSDARTDVFTKELTGRALIRLDFDQTPVWFRQYIAARAARRMHAQFRGDPVGTRDAQVNEAVLRRIALASDANVRRYNSINSEPVRRILGLRFRRHRDIGYQ